MENDMPDMTLPARAGNPDAPGSARTRRRRADNDQRTEAGAPAMALAPLLSRLARR
jgi:hypothetical protein